MAVSRSRAEVERLSSETRGLSAQASAADAVVAEYLASKGVDVAALDQRGTSSWGLKLGPGGSLRAEFDAFADAVTAGVARAGALSEVLASV